MYLSPQLFEGKFSTLWFPKRSLPFLLLFAKNSLVGYRVEKREKENTIPFALFSSNFSKMFKRKEYD